MLTSSRRVASVLAVLIVLLMVGRVLAANAVLHIGLVDRQEQRPAYQELFRRFMAENPEVEVEVIGMPGGEERNERLTVLYAGGQMPDIWGEGGHTATWFVSDWFLDLSSYFERDKAELRVNDYLPTAMANVTRSGRIIGLPWGTSTTAFAYNRNHLNEAGLAFPPVSWENTSWTYEQMVGMAKRLTKRDSEGRVERFGFEAWLWEDYVVTWAHCFGGDWFDRESYKTGIVERITINSPETQAAYEELMRLMYEDQVMPAPDHTVWVTDPAHWEPFASGDIAMRISSSWAYSMYIDAHLDNWALAAIPQFPAGRQNLCFNDAWHVFRNTKYPDQAWELIKFLSSKESMEYFSKETLFGPARISALNPYVSYLSQRLGMSTPEIIEVMVGSQAHGIESQDHVLVGWYEFRQIAGDLLWQVWNKSKPLLSQLEEAQRQLQAKADEIRAHFR